MRHRHRPVRLERKRNGNIVVLTAFAMIAIVVMMACAIDIGYMYTMQTQLDRSVDAAALAGAGMLSEGVDEANDKVVEYLVRNPMGGAEMATCEDQLATLQTEFLTDHSEDMEVRAGHWNASTRTFQESDELPSALSVTMTYPSMPTFFGRALGRQSFQIRSESIAMYQPRDMMLAIDLSASMNDDSEFSSIGTLGKSYIDQNSYQMWLDLGSPTYGNMGFEPDWVTIPYSTVPASVKWLGTAVDVTATSSIQQIKLYNSSGSTKTFTNPAPGTFTYSSNLIYKCDVKIANKTETVDFFNDSHILRGLGLSGVAYPTEGSWNDFIQYCRSHTSRMSWYDSSVDTAGYRRKFGVKSLINFCLKNKPSYAQTPTLWKVSAQPITALKDSVDVFLNYVGAVDVDDRVGLAVYDSADGYAKTERALSTDLDQISELTHHRQAGHYHGWTNIAAGLKNAREELQAHARNGAYKMIVLITDGNANWVGTVNNGYDPTTANQNVINEANQCKALKYKVVTISLGSEADTSIMQQVADITDAVHFNVPGGSSVSAYSTELTNVFKTIASARPLKLVK